MEYLYSHRDAAAKKHGSGKGATFGEPALSFLRLLRQAGESSSKIKCSRCAAGACGAENRALFWRDV
jgi:hypothetical protein